MDAETDGQPPAQPEKKMALFQLDEQRTATAREVVVEGCLGDLPLLVGISTGYDHEIPDPFMYPYETQEILFAYERRSQVRVLLQDSHLRSLSLPVTSPLQFQVEGEEGKVTMSEVLATRHLPVSLRFARSHSLGFMVNSREQDHTYFGPLHLVGVYEEPYLLCISVRFCGKVRSPSIVLPGNLLDVLLAPVGDVTGVADPQAKIIEFKQTFSEVAKQLSVPDDPFFQELAMVSGGPLPVTEVGPYIDQNTYIAIFSKLPPLPPLPACTATGSLPKLLHLNHQNVDRNCLSMSIDSPLSDNSVGTLISDVHPFLQSRSSSSTKHQTDSSWPDFQDPEDFADVDDEVNIIVGAESSSSDSDSEGIKFLLHDRLSSSATPPLSTPAPAITPRHVPWKDILAAMSVDEVGQVLPSLALNKFRKVFCRHRIDGVLLQKLTDDTLVTEFKMKPLEIIRLNAFIQEGHIPKTSQK